KLDEGQLKSILYKKFRSIDKLNYRLSVYKCGGSLSNLSNLYDNSGQKLLQFIDYFLDQIRDEKQTEELDFYNLNNDYMIFLLNKNQLIDFIEKTDDYIYQIIEDFRDYQDYKNNGF
ncbi:MAG: hypothetical protein E7J62_05590, partial [Serratia marcescens]|nr:hypothetical protein [Serratia marcescens]